MARDKQGPSSAAGVRQRMVTGASGLAVVSWSRDMAFPLTEPKRAVVPVLVPRQRGVDPGM